METDEDEDPQVLLQRRIDEMFDRTDEEYFRIMQLYVDRVIAVQEINS